ncbi:class I poly(R)-hydroxyalkanoic acid synthase [Legionella anisa]|uniref:Class I poly(R)-hydroxyalkanoic acid synthase n=1 Tax=Legionella anisa TaxID=28082 RepID=A0AAX0WQ19_9GAMM|nr:class I poly(R)-hydroxyalkanoic acid synthase [Legionella anisa]AWN75329.1 class I poly(R)-hydroxyalkanoic acid synthase [Legionella anisa]KTC72692.1 poly-beta-hydroxybutyrate synthase [Legionella anisa]MCW8424499.1 class I poly(R)-hydroxyalkanoic acid synthase [Legionella anisa]MCW8446383.1 class I poly(R)-hydroxyalkanoic acid synthase [Legionella anisa]PNL60767.1 class I poly(R)-hydroxyalkanoic acid synthase [Legionella anisa]
MTHDKELAELLHAIAEKSLQIISEIKETPLQVPVIINQYIELTEHFQNVMSILLQNPEKIWEMQLAYWQDAFNLAQTQLQHWLNGTSMPINDPRFHEEDWLHNPFFNMLTQHYLLASQHMNALFENLEYPDPNTAKRLQFFTKQYLDALSPANFLHTNPQIMDETLKSHGKNLLQGLHNLLSDLEVGSPRLMIKMTDTQAFELGKNIAITPGKVVFRNNMMELIQYTPQTAKVKSTPLLMIPPWINKYYILDLSPHNSLILWLVKQGITVFIISWINPDSNFSHKSLYDYLNEGPLTAISTIQKQLHVKQVNTMGFCIGGTLLSMLLAYNKAHQDNSIRSATFLASMIDFSDPGDIAVFIDEQQIAKLEDEMKSKGYLAGKFMASSFNSLRANDLIWSFFIKNYLRGKNPVPFDILYWNSDSTNMPATMHSQYLRWMYLHNDLVKPGKIHLNHTPIDVSTIDIPTFFLSTEKDHIAPWKTTYLGFQLMNGPKRFVLGGSGHIAGIINAPDAKKYGYKVNHHVPAHAEQWLEQATEHPGSWWPEWLKWLKTHSGKLIPAPDLNQLPLKPLMDAPGSYVMKK